MERAGGAPGGRGLEHLERQRSCAVDQPGRRSEQWRDGPGDGGDRCVRNRQEAQLGPGHRRRVRLRQREPPRLASSCRGLGPDGHRPSGLHQLDRDGAAQPAHADHQHARPPGAGRRQGLARGVRRSGCARSSPAPGPDSRWPPCRPGCARPGAPRCSRCTTWRTGRAPRSGSISSSSSSASTTSSPAEKAMPRSSARRRLLSSSSIRAMRPELLSAERAEHQPLVDAVPQLGRQRPPRLGERRRRAALVRRVRAEAHPGPRPSEGLGPEVGGEHHHRAREVDLAALAVGEPALLEQLEEQHQHVAVRLLHLVQQHHRARPSADRLGELAAVLVADVPRRRADEAGGGVRLGQLAHVEPDERVAASRRARRPARGPARSCRPRSVRGRGSSPADGGWRSRRSCAGAPVATRSTASAWPTTRAPSSSSRRSSRAASPVRSRSTGSPAMRATTSATSLTSTRSRPARAQREPARSSERHRLVRIVPVGHVPRGERRGRLHRWPGVAHPVVLLVAGEQPGEDLHRLGHRRLAHHHRGEAPLQRCVRLDEAPELVVGRRPDAGELAAGQGALQLVGRVLGALAGGPGADQGVDLVEEDHQPAAGAAHLVLEAVQPFRQRAPERRAGQEVRRRQLDDDPLPQLAGRRQQALCHAFDHRGLAHARARPPDRGCWCGACRGRRAPRPSRGPGRRPGRAVPRGPGR